MGPERTPETTGARPDLRSRSAPVIERAPLPIVEVRGDAHIVSYVNSAFCSLLGKTRAELIGNPFAELLPRGHECIPLLDRVYEKGEAVTHVQQEDSDSDPACWLYAMWPTLDPDERPMGVIIQLTKTQAFSQSGAAITEALLIAGLRQHELTEVAEKLNVQLRREVVERKVAEAALHEAKDRLADRAGELERLVVERTEKLRETVGELEAFSYSVAHNMRAPLRGMQGFARILLDEHADQLNPEAHSYLERIASSAVRMDTLIRDVLDYTKVLRDDARLTPVDLDRLVRDLLATYPDWQPPMADVRVEGTLPFVLGHEGFLTQCVSNLVDNAIEFVATGVTPRVRIGSAAGGDSGAPTVRVWFSDNGIGIAPKDHDRVFRMFEHINPANELEGTGIGLTIARKAVERMGGHIDYESEPGAGSKFWIELKRAPPTL